MLNIPPGNHTATGLSTAAKPMSNRCFEMCGTANAQRPGWTIFLVSTGKGYTGVVCPALQVKTTYLEFVNFSSGEKTREKHTSCYPRVLRFLIQSWVPYSRWRDRLYFKRCEDQTAKNSLSLSYLRILHRFFHWFCTIILTVVLHHLPLRIQWKLKFEDMKFYSCFLICYAAR